VNDCGCRHLSLDECRLLRPLHLQDRVPGDQRLRSGGERRVALWAN